MQRQSLSGRAFDAFNVALLIALMVICAYPFLYILFVSVSDPLQIVSNTGIILWPKGFSLGAYERVFANPMILKGYANTLLYVTLGTATNLALTSLGAYVLSRKGLLWGRALNLLVAFTMFFNGGMIPTYLIVRSLGLMDNIWAMVLPTAVSTWNLILMRTSFENIPVELEESARLDGAGDMTILLRIVLPLSASIMAVMVLFYGVAHWNAWFNATLYLRKRELLPLQVILREILIINDTTSMSTDMAMSADKEMVSQTIQYATVIVATAPILCAYPFLQKYFVKGVMVGAVKG